MKKNQHVTQIKAGYKIYLKKEKNKHKKERRRKE
jgi:hypothetical protein